VIAVELLVLVLVVALVERLAQRGGLVEVRGEAVERAHVVAFDLASPAVRLIVLAVAASPVRDVGAVVVDSDLIDRTTSNARELLVIAVHTVGAARIEL